MSGVVARTEDDEERIEYRIEPIGNVANQTPTSGDFARGRIIVQLNQPITKRLVALGRTAFDWDAADKLKIDGDAVFSLGRLRVPNESIEFRTRDADSARYAEGVRIRLRDGTEVGAGRVYAKQLLRSLAKVG